MKAKRKRINNLVATTDKDGTKRRYCDKIIESHKRSINNQPKYFIRFLGELKEIKKEDIHNYKSFEIIIK